ncbi:hypothetical protein C8F01DRAFT_689486 [Mycena amicta]|nr:hypothetical protein C8F01DRAFT_689486 [Mycena amicta]
MSSSRLPSAHSSPPALWMSSVLSAVSCSPLLLRHWPSAPVLSGRMLSGLLHYDQENELEVVAPRRSPFRPSLLPLEVALVGLGDSCGSYSASNTTRRIAFISQKCLARSQASTSIHHRQLRTMVALSSWDPTTSARWTSATTSWIFLIPRSTGSLYR